MADTRIPKPERLLGVTQCVLCGRLFLGKRRYQEHFAETHRHAKSVVGSRR